MWSVWFVFCDCGFHSVCSLGKDKRLMKASWWGRLTVDWQDWLGLVLMGRAVLSKSLIQFSVDWQHCVPSLLFDLRPNYGGGKEENGNLLQKVPGTHCHTQCSRPCNRPPTHASTGDFRTLTGKSESVSCGVTAPFSWVLVHARFCLCPSRVCFPSPM